MTDLFCADMTDLWAVGVAELLRGGDRA